MYSVCAEYRAAAKGGSSLELGVLVEILLGGTQR